MEFNKLVFAGLAVGCLTAAAGGSYLAVRQNAAPAAAVMQPSTDLAPTAAPASSQPVTESEGVITPDTPAKPETRTAEPVAPVAPVEPVGPVDPHAPAVSPWRLCAGHALMLIVIVTPPRRP